MYSRYDYLVCVLLDPAIPTSFFKFIQLFFILVLYTMKNIFQVIIFTLHACAGGKAIGLSVCRGHHCRCC